MIRIFTALLLLGTLCTGSAAAREHRLTIGNDDFESTLLAADSRIRFSIRKTAPNCSRPTANRFSNSP